MATKDDGNLELWVIAVIATVTIVGTCCVVWFAWWCVVGRKLRTHPENHPFSEQVMRPTLKGDSERWQREQEAKRGKVAATAFKPLELGLRLESEILCGKGGSRV